MREKMDLARPEDPDTAHLLSQMAVVLERALAYDLESAKTLILKFYHARRQPRQSDMPLAHEWADDDFHHFGAERCALMAHYFIGVEGHRGHSYDQFRAWEQLFREALASRSQGTSPQPTQAHLLWQHLANKDRPDAF